MTDTQIRKGAHPVGNRPASALPNPPAGPPAGAITPGCRSPLLARPSALCSARLQAV